jgi:high-affinity iron transporter
MKTVFNFILLASLAASARAQKSTPLEKLASLVDYIAADYPGAVKDGKVIAESEFKEQQGMIAEAHEVFLGLHPTAGHEAARLALSTELGVLEKDVIGRASEDRIAADCRQIHKRLLDDYGLVLAPLAPPDQARAKIVYASACADCHGKDGHADTQRAKELKPPPVNFFEGDRMARISPALAFHALTFGVTNTAMASFETLPPSDRWSLAFHVISLRHASADAKRGKALLDAAKVPLALSASRLAELSDQELSGLLAPYVRADADRADVIAYLRREAAFVTEPGGTFAAARRLLAETSANATDRKRCKELAIAAYLEGIEPHEASLKAQDRPLADRIEKAFFELRRVIDAGAGPDAIRGEVARVTLVLDGADERGAAGVSVPFFAAFAIALREGFELSLLVAALLAFVRKSGHGELARFIHLGWAAAIPAGVIAWFAVGAVLAGAQRELTEGILTLLAASMLLFVSHFVLGKLESRKWLKFLEKKTKSAADTERPIPWPLIAVAFVAAFREAIEVVLFFRALILDAPGAGFYVLGGAASGIAVLMILVRAMSSLGKRLNPRPLMLVSGILLTAIAISLVGQGIRSLQEGGYIHLEPMWAGLTVPVLGIFPSVEGVSAQLVVLLLVVVPALQRKKENTPKLA